MRYTVGGHYPNPILTTDKPQYLPGRGHPVGIIPSPKYEVETVDFPPNSSLAIFSDGVMEIIEEPNSEAKEAFLLDTITKANGDKDKIMAYLNVAEASELPDDLTFLLVQHR